MNATLIWGTLGVLALVAAWMAGRATTRSAAAVLRCGACFRPGVLVPPDQPRRAGRCRLPHGHEGDCDFPLLDEVSP